MTAELWAALIGAVVLLLTNTAAVVKIWGDNIATKDDRAATKEARNKDSAELHDAVQKAIWDIQLLKDNAQHRDTLIEDLQKQINALNSTLAVTNTQLHTLVDAIKELKGTSNG